MIQSVDTQNPVLLLAAKQDYETFYKQEIDFRKLAMYPPFCSICIVGFAGKNQNEVQSAANAFAQMLIAGVKNYNDIPLRILGPAAMQPELVAEKYRYCLTLKCKINASLRQLVNNVSQEYNKLGLHKKANFWLDLNADG
jgi:primosomal protein N' (replication factor Y)